MKKLVFACVFLVGICKTVAAEMIDECHRDLRPDIRIRACTEIINNTSYSANDKSVAYASRGKARTEAGAIQLAVTDFTESIRLKSDNAPAFAGRGRARLAIGDLTGSIDDYTQAIRFSPASSEFYIGRGHVHTVSGNFDAAIRDLTHAIRLDSRNWSAFNERGIAYFRKSDWQRALADFTDAIAIVPLPAIYANRGLVYEAQNRRAEAVKDLRKALVGDPSLIDARDGLKRLGADEAAVTSETERRIRQGAALAEKNCGNCHAVGANGVSADRNATEFRNLYRRYPLFTLRAPVTQGILASHEKMPGFKVSFEEVDTIVAYINSLSPGR